MERKREALLKEASECSGLDESTIQNKLAEIDSLKPRPYGTLQAASEIYNEAGVIGFWKGIIPTLIMVCNLSIQFMIYETSMRSLREKRAAKKHGTKPITALEMKMQDLMRLDSGVRSYLRSPLVPRTSESFKMVKTQKLEMTYLAYDLLGSLRGPRHHSLGAHGFH